MSRMVVGGMAHPENPAIMSILIQTKERR